MPNCPNCDKPLEQIPHKRPKQFCNSTCRSNFWQKQQRLKNKEVEKSSHKKKKTVTPPSTEAATYDFAGMKWLEIEKVTKFPIKNRPTDFDERLVWDKARRLEHEEIRKQWANRNKKS